jgi:two-component system OmpR family sensor kinase
MLVSEKRSLFRFLTIYLSSTFLLFFSATLIFYHYQKHNILDTQRDTLKSKAYQISQELRKLHEQFNPPLIYPSHPLSAIYNSNRNYIFGSFNPSKPLWEKESYIKNDNLFYFFKLEPYYLGAKYLLVSQNIEHGEIIRLQKTLLFFLLIAGLFFSLLALVLGRLFTSPMKESMSRVNRFIEDTTHELNTPISTILTNIELIETLYDCKAKKEMKRIEIASKTLSRLYDDLTYLKLNHNYHRAVEPVDMGYLLKERLLYFQSMIETKSLALKESISEDVIIDIDRNDALRLIDNLLSNAIKYNQKNGKIIIILNQLNLYISDNGIGIKEEDLDQIHERFNRANKSEGGFGIGLDIVGQVVNEYGFEFTINSIYKEGTEVTIAWQ